MTTDNLQLIREKIDVQVNNELICLKDPETGFAVELQGDYFNKFYANPEKEKDFWNTLRSLGFTQGSDCTKSNRQNQREFLLFSYPDIVERLRERISLACEEVPFFKQRISLYEKFINGSMDDFQTLPFMRKEDIRNSFPRGLLPEHIDIKKGIEDGSLTIMSTSGSTADRLQIVVNTEIDRLPFGSDDLFNINIGGEQPKTALFTTPICSGTECRVGISSYEERLCKNVPEIFLNSPLNPFDLSAEFIKGFVDDIIRFSPKILAADPMYLLCVVRKAEELGIQLPKVDLIQKGFEFGHAIATKRISQHFKTPVLDDYGASEENRIAIQCHHGKLHVRSDVLHMEIIKQSGPCKVGEVGAVAITTFDSITPLIRYLIGDIAEWTGETCQCQYSKWPTIRVHGRAKDMFKIDSKWISTLQIDDLIGEPNWLDFYQVLETKTGRYQVSVIPRQGFQVDRNDLIERLSPIIPESLIDIKVESQFSLLQSMKIGVTRTELGGAPELL